MGCEQGYICLLNNIYRDMGRISKTQGDLSVQPW